MSEATTLRSLLPDAPPQLLACRLRTKQVNGRRGPISQMGEIELENVSATPLEIAYRMTVLQFLNLVVTAGNGAVVSTGHFGDRFAPTLEPLVMRLNPGEKLTANVPLFATVPRNPIPPGTYSVQAVYEYHGFQAVSNSVQVTV